MLKNIRLTATELLSNDWWAVGFSPRKEREASFSLMRGVSVAANDGVGNARGSMVRHRGGGRERVALRVECCAAGGDHLIS